MTQRHTFSAPRRVLAVHRDPLPPGVVACGQPGWTRVGSCRHGAARIALQPPDWLVLDLRTLGRRELPLLDVARRHQVRILALGPKPLGLSDRDLQGVEILTARELARQLRQAAGQDESPEPAGEQPGPEETEETETEETAGTPAPREARDRPEAAELTDEDLPDELIRELEQDVDVEDKPLHSVLTPEELAALLEDRS